MSKYLRLGYVMDDSIHTISEADAKMLTHVNLAFGLIKNGLLDMGWLAHIDYMDEVRKYNPDIKIVVSIGGWGAGGFSNMCMTKESRAAFCESVVKAIKEYNLDGIDIDWEYPCSDGAGIDADPKDKQNFTYLMQDLRAAIGPDKSLSIAAGAGADFIGWTEMDKVAKVCDYVQIMTYDMRGYGKLTGHHTGLYATPGDPNPNNTKHSVDLMIEAGVPAEKLVIGSAFYCRAFNGVESEGPVVPCKGVPEKRYGSYGMLVENYINKNGFKRYWDDDAKAPYLYDGDVYLTYDDPESVKYKCEYLKEANLLGIMYWAHRDGCSPLLEVMYNELK